jgi:hypothetical protein
VGLRAQQNLGRPLAVWCLSLGYSLVAVGSIVNSASLALGIIAWPEPYRSRLADPAALQWVPSLVGALLMIAFCVALFRLRVSSVHWCETLLVFSLLATCIQFARVGLPEGELRGVALASTGVSLGLLGAIYVYSRRLRSRGVLT